MTGLQTEGNLGSDRRYNSNPDIRFHFLVHYLSYSINSLNGVIWGII